MSTVFCPYCDRPLRPEVSLPGPCPHCGRHVPRTELVSWLVPAVPLAGLLAIVSIIGLTVTSGRPGKSPEPSAREKSGSPAVASLPEEEGKKQTPAKGRPGESSDDMAKAGATKGERGQAGPDEEGRSGPASPRGVEAQVKRVELGPAFVRNLAADATPMYSSVEDLRRRIQANILSGEPAGTLTEQKMLLITLSFRQPGGEQFLFRRPPQGTYTLTDDRGNVYREDRPPPGHSYDGQAEPGEIRTVTKQDDLFTFSAANLPGAKTLYLKFSNLQGKSVTFEIPTKSIAK